MADALEQVLRLVAEGRLTAEQAAPILDALGTAGFDEPDEPEPREEPSGSDPRSAAGAPRETATAIRIEIHEGGRRVLNLRVPVSLGRMAFDRIPGLAASSADLVRRALADGRSGTLLDIDDEGDGVRIALE
jgi:hypothetical protein